MLDRIGKVGLPRLALFATVLLALATGGCDTDTPTGPANVQGTDTTFFMRIAADDSHGAIAGVVFDDLDQNGVQDTGEPGMEGLTVGLADPGGMTTTATTDADGQYAFDDLDPAFYIVTAPTVPGYISSTPINVSTLVVVGETARVDFGLYTEALPEPGSISGMVFDDANMNGVFDPGEAGLAGLEVMLTLPDASTASTTTDTGGLYAFADLAAGEYTVTGPAVAGWVASTPIEVSVTVDAGAESAGIDFGLYLEVVEPDPDTVGGIVYDDLDGNGTWDEGEPGLAGVVVRLSSRNNPRNDDTRPGHGIHHYATTGDDGTYLFEDVPAGRWRVFPKTPCDYHRTSPKDAIVTVDAGEYVEGIDFGFAPHDDDCDDVDEDDCDGDDDGDDEEPQD